MKKITKYILLCLVFGCFLSGCSSAPKQTTKTASFPLETKDKEKTQKVSVKYPSDSYNLIKEDDTQFIVTKKGSDDAVINGGFFGSTSIIQHKYYATTSGIPNISDQKKETTNQGTIYQYTYKESDNMIQYVYVLDFNDSDYGLVMYVYNNQKEFTNAIKNITFNIEK